jgi:hypothetical protein
VQLGRLYTLLCCLQRQSKCSNRNLEYYLKGPYYCCSSQRLQVLTYILEVPDRVSGMSPDILTQIFRDFLQAFQAGVGKVCWTQTIITEIFRGFIVLLQTNAGIVP